MPRKATARVDILDTRTVGGNRIDWECEGAVMASMTGAIAVNALPYESRLSFTMYSSWLNATGGSPITQPLGASTRGLVPPKRASRDDPVLKRAWLFAPHRGVVPYLMSCPVKLCPICIESAYHSYLYQIDGLHLCPIHNCKLIGRCMTCGAPLSESVKVRTGSLEVYQCYVCGEPLSGTPASPEARLHLSSMRESIVIRLSPYIAWFAGVELALRSFECWGDKAADNSGVPAAHALLARAAVLLCEPPLDYSYPICGGDADFFKSFALSERLESLGFAAPVLWSRLASYLARRTQTAPDTVIRCRSLHNAEDSANKRLRV